MAFEVINELFTDKTVNRVGLMAGTGTGKSAVAFATADAAIRAGYSKVIISTASISLAQQYENDLPRQAAALPHRYAVSSGLENTLCKLALQLELNVADGSVTDDDVPVHIRQRSTAFSRWPISKEDKHLSVRRAADETDGWPCYDHCPYLYDCAVYEQRDRSYNAQIIVANAIQVAWLLTRQRGFDNDDVFLIVDEADKAVEQLPLERWGTYQPVSLDEVLAQARKVVFMSGTLTSPIADRLGCQRYVILPHLDRSNAPVLIDGATWYDRLGEFARRYAHLPGMVITPNSRMRDVAREVIEECGLRTVDYDMTTNRQAIKGDHIASVRSGAVPPVLLGFHAGAGIGLDLPGDLLGWIAIVGRPYGSECAEDKVPVRDQAERSDNLIVQSIGRACRFDGDACRVVWYTAQAKDVDRVIARIEDEGVPVKYANAKNELEEWLNNEAPFSWQQTTIVDLDDDW